jgi:hypothetical protein
LSPEVCNQPKNPTKTVREKGKGGFSLMNSQTVLLPKEVEILIDELYKWKDLKTKRIFANSIKALIMNPYRAKIIALKSQLDEAIKKEDVKKAEEIQSQIEDIRKQLVSDVKFRKANRYLRNLNSSIREYEPHLERKGKEKVIIDGKLFELARKINPSKPVTVFTQKQIEEEINKVQLEG